MDYKQNLDLPQAEIEKFLLLPKTPEMAKIKEFPKEHDQINKMIEWKNRLKEKTNTQAVKNAWDYTIPAMAGLATMAGTYTFSKEETSALGIGFLTTLSTGFLQNFIANQKQEALSEIKYKKEILPEIYYFFNDIHTNNVDKQKIQENLENISPVEMTLLRDLSTTELKAFFTGEFKQQEYILNHHKFSDHSWRETAKCALTFTSTKALRDQAYINSRNLVNNISMRRLERNNFSRNNSLKI